MGSNRVGDFGLLLGILGRIRGSFEFRDLFKILNNLVSNNQIGFIFLTLCAVLVFSGVLFMYGYQMPWKGPLLFRL